MFSTIFRQNAFYLFEVDIHTHRREKGELKTEEFNHYLQKRMQAMFGKGLHLTDGHRFWWMPVMHFYHFNFYVFSYAFGELLTTALYDLYKDKGEAFIGSYLEALSTGGSKDPYEITQIMGVDLDDPKFWDRGLDMVKEQVDRFKELAAST